MPTLQMRKLRLMRVGDLTAVTQLVPCEGVTYCLSFCLPAHRLGPSSCGSSGLVSTLHPPPWGWAARTAQHILLPWPPVPSAPSPCQPLSWGDGRLDMVWGRVGRVGRGVAGRPGRDLRPCKVDPPGEQVRAEAQGLHLRWRHWGQCRR